MKKLRFGENSLFLFSFFIPLTFFTTITLINKDDYIILRMNIEGAEYEVLDKMLSTGVINMINKLSLSTHEKKMKVNVNKYNKTIKRASLACDLLVTKKEYY